MIFQCQIKKKLANKSVGNNNIDKRYKEEKRNDKRNWDFGRFPYVRDYKYWWKNESTEKLSSKCPVPGCKFGGFSKVYDKYQTILTKWTITNNGNHDYVIAPNWNWVDWNYGEKRGRKRSTKIAIITHFAKM